MGGASSRYMSYVGYIARIIIGAILSFFALTSILVWDLSKSDLAAWVQAIGSIGAIWGALWMFGRESSQKSRDEIDRRKNIRQIALTVLRQSSHRIYATYACMERYPRHEHVEKALINDLDKAYKWLEIIIGNNSIDSRYLSLLIRMMVEINLARTIVSNWDSMLADPGGEPSTHLKRCLVESEKLLSEV